MVDCIGVGGRCDLCLVDVVDGDVVDDEQE